MTQMNAHQSLATITRGLRRDSLPMRLFEKAKIYGIWNPSHLDFTQDAADWAALAPDEQDVILRLTAMFQAGEEAVTLDLLPLIMTIAREGRIEEELFLTTFLWEEAKHTDFFSRFLSEVVKTQTDLTAYTLPSYRGIVYDALPAALNRLIDDSSPAAQIVAAVTYNMIVEGVLAETGYHAYHSMLARNGLMPATCQGLIHLKQDESRHIAYGLYLISRLIAADDSLWEVTEMTMNTLLMTALSVIPEMFSLYDPMPFGLEIDEFTEYASTQFQHRYGRLLAARGKNVDEIGRLASSEQEEALA